MNDINKRYLACVGGFIAHTLILIFVVMLVYMLIVFDEPLNHSITDCDILFNYITDLNTADANYDNYQKIHDYLCY